MGNAQAAACGGVEPETPRTLIVRCPCRLAVPRAAPLARCGEEFFARAAACVCCVPAGAREAAGFSDIAAGGCLVLLVNQRAGECSPCACVARRPVD